VAASPDYDPSKNQLVALLSGIIYWRSLIRDILPKGSNGIHLVFSNPCTKSFTYEINGPKVRFLGGADHHQSKYSSKGISRSLNEIRRSTKNSLVYTGAPLDEEYCTMTLQAYPSDTMKASYTTSNPIIFTIAVIFIFAFVSLVFYLYDAKVERRQQSVMSSAVRTSAIVSSLFPSEVRDRLYPAAGGWQSTSPETAKGKLNSFLRESRQPTNGSVESSLMGSAPIAELYPETTVLFADISGFTAWSSERHPAQVFHLLETVYAAFDAIAKTRGVFKVETIGDCYVAVVGLPTHRKHHAVVMARFARDCRDKMKLLTQELASTLGPVRLMFAVYFSAWTSSTNEFRRLSIPQGTTELTMRFGLNSGPTTAGVLRGDKSRFQLFGDVSNDLPTCSHHQLSFLTRICLFLQTVNTAARMESNGMRNKIQVSQKTAELLRLAGKEYVCHVHFVSCIQISYHSH
jgi:class 3 adenylate cyclase